MAATHSRMLSECLPRTQDPLEEPFSNYVMPFLSGACQTSSQILDLLLPTEHYSVTARFTLLSLRALLACPQATPNQRALIDRLLALVCTPEGCPSTGLRRACLVEKIHLLLDEADTGCGGEVNPLAVQKCYCLVGLRLRSAWMAVKAAKGDVQTEGELLSLSA